MFGVAEGKVLEEFGVAAGLICVQVVLAGSGVFMSHLMSIGLGPLCLVVYGAFATFVFLLPLSVYFERHEWPKKFSIKLMIQWVLIAFGGVTLFQSFFLEGVKKTSPAIASVMPNLAPGFIFFISWALRLEKVKLSCIYSKAKIIGTLLCVVGAIMMSLLLGIQHFTNLTTTPPASTVPPSSETPFSKDRIIGCLYLLAAVLVLSCSVVLQAMTLIDFPAPISLCTVTSLIGAILTAILQLIQEHKIETGWPILGVRDLIIYSLTGGIVSGLCITFQTWALKKKGPVLVSMFGPVGTVFCVVISAITLGDSITLGSIAGMFVMFTGLYLMLWAKAKEGYSLEDEGTKSFYDAEQSLLS